MSVPDGGRSRVVGVVPVYAPVAVTYGPVKEVITGLGVSTS